MQVKNIFLLIIGLLISHALTAQTLHSNKRKKTQKKDNVTFSIKTKKQFLSKSDNLEYFFCSSNGFSNININEIKKDIISQYAIEDNEAIIVGTSNGKLLKINNFSYNNTSTEVLCDFGIGLTDVAVDEKKNYYGSFFNKIFSIDNSTCKTTDLPLDIYENSYLNSLSFDKLGNLYFGYGARSDVFVYNPNKTPPNYIWHDFQEGISGGDFVQIKDKIYISWVNNGFKLYEVTVDANNDYASHISLDFIPNNTFGLAAELGKLYGITPHYLYEINLDELSTTPVLQNNLSYGDWWGGAGLHEAIEFDVNIYENILHAENQINELPNIWTNTIDGGQTIYARLNNLETNTYEFIEIKILVSNPPIINDTNTYNACSNSNIFFDISELDNLLVNDKDHLTITYHETFDKAEKRLNILDKTNVNYSNTNNGILFVRVEDDKSKCFSIKELMIELNRKPFIEIKNQVICNEENIINVNADTGYVDDSYLWSNNETSSSIDITDIGDYWVKITAISGCESTFKFKVSNSNLTKIESTEIINFSDPNSIEVNISGTGNYLFKLDDNPPQVSNVFSNVSIGYHTIYVIDTTGCETISKEVVVIDFPKFLTPNNDGSFDTWHLTGVENFPGTIINIYDRYGKLLKTLTSDSAGWDGTYNGKLMLVDDYWFQANVIDGLNSFKASGHFTLKL